MRSMIASNDDVLIDMYVCCCLTASIRQGITVFVLYDLYRAFVQSRALLLLHSAKLVESSIRTCVQTTLLQQWLLPSFDVDLLRSPDASGTG